MSGQKQATVQAWVMPHLLAYLEDRGVDSAQLRDRAGLRGRDLDDPDARIPDIAAREAWRLAVELTGDSALGLHMAQAIPAGALDLLEFAFRSSPTLEAGFERLARYGRVMSDRAAARLIHEDQAVAVTWDGRVQRSRVDFALGLIVRFAREATDRWVTPIEVRFAYEPASDEDQQSYREYFGAPLRYNAALNQAVFGPRDLGRPLVSADVALAGVVRRRLDKMLAQLPAQDESIVARVRREVIEQFAEGEPTAAAVGRVLGMSERTLHRRLRDERSSFRGVLDEVREEMARALLRDRAVGIAEIAFVLGYSEPAAFHRSFRRWTGQTPLTFRRAAS
jgi:AraC-like DNA-binding protein